MSLSPFAGSFFGEQTKTNVKEIFDFSFSHVLTSGESDLKNPVSYIKQVYHGYDTLHGTVT